MFVFLRCFLNWFCIAFLLLLFSCLFAIYALEKQLFRLYYGQNFKWHKTTVPSRMYWLDLCNKTVISAASAATAVSKKFENKKRRIKRQILPCTNVQSVRMTTNKKRSDKNFSNNCTSGTCNANFFFFRHNYLSPISALECQRWIKHIFRVFSFEYKLKNERHKM